MHETILPPKSAVSLETSKTSCHNLALQVGSGTDPTEGAALAAAVLQTLAGRSRLTMASTHHAELNNLAVRACLLCASHSNLLHSAEFMRLLTACI